MAAETTATTTSVAEGGEGPWGKWKLDLDRSESNEAMMKAQVERELYIYNN